MAHVSGPCSTLPGSIHVVPDGIMCDVHPHRPAVKRVQGETDSFGAEYSDACQECVDAFRNYRESDEARHGACDWCKNHATDLRPRRDFEEGMNGPVYQVCGACVRRENEQIAEELGDWDDDRDDYGFDDY